MDTKNYTQVLIDGKVYTLGGSEDESYLQKAASYVNEKNSDMRKIPGFSKQSADYQMIMTELNIADDYFKAVEWAEGMERQKNDMEKETYSLKHELVSTQMKLEAVLKDLEERQRELDRLNRHTAQLEGELKEARENLESLRTRPSSTISSDRSRTQVNTLEKKTETVETIESTDTIEAVETIEAAEITEAKASETKTPETKTEETKTSGTKLPETITQEIKAGTMPSGPVQTAPVLKVLNTAPETAKGLSSMTTHTASTQAAATAAPLVAPLAGGMSDEELARKALQAAKKAGSHKGGRR